MKVFLSHSTKDKQFVQALAAELEAEKIEHWLCEVDIDFGQNFVAEIEKGLREADLTILFWSPDAAHSDWTLIEWTSVLAREISEARTRLGVVLLGDYALPELLRVKHWIDARTDPEKALQEIVAWIKRLRGMRRLVETIGAGVFLPDPPHRLEEALVLLKKQEALCLQLGNRSGLGYCYSNWALLAREQRDRNTEHEKLAASLVIFTDLKMPRECDEVRAELEKTTAVDGDT
jgi:hypothetical protein